MSGMPPEDVIKTLYKTTFQKDYIPKQYSKPKPVKQEQEFKDPIGAGFARYLKIDEEVEPPCEDADQFLEKLKDRESNKIKELYFKEPLDHITIKQDVSLEDKTEYQVEYCDIENEIRKRLLEGEHQKFSLPEGWTTPETTHKIDFRNPVLLNPRAMVPPLVIIPKYNLRKNEKYNEILQVKTGSSTYEDTIGTLGDFIVRNQMHGKITHPKID